MPNYGSLITLDTLATQLNQTVAQLGMDAVFQGIEVALAAHNEIMRDMMALLTVPTQDRLRRYGANSTIDLIPVDETGIADAQKLNQGSNVGFPLNLFSVTLQWNRKYFQNATGAELAAQITGMMQGDARRLNYELKSTIFNPVNNNSYTDRYVDGVTLPLKRLVNADGAPIPDSPQAVTFDPAVHTHYLGTASFVNADVVALLETVVEHFNQGRPMIFINRAQEATIRGFSAFLQYPYDGAVMPTTAAYAGGVTLDANNLYNRAIGTFDGAQVWVKPWVPAGYVFCTLDGAPKPLALRTRRADSGNLEAIFEDDEAPWHAKAWEREFGFGIWERVNGAVLDTAHSTYTAPTLTI